VKRGYEADASSKRLLGKKKGLLHEVAEADC
jgi:hypothetical protein